MMTLPLDQRSAVETRKEMPAGETLGQTSGDLPRALARTLLRWQLGNGTGTSPDGGNDRRTRRLPAILLGGFAAFFLLLWLTTGLGIGASLAFAVGAALGLAALVLLVAAIVDRLMYRRRFAAGRPDAKSPTASPEA